jgi:hypothetical protein
LTSFSADEDNDAMARPDDRLSALSNEAGELLKLAEQYREKIKSLPPDDPTRRELESVILNLLDRADALSQTVRSSVGKS